jgi:hypothetical protein
MLFEIVDNKLPVMEKYYEISSKSLVVVAKCGTFKIILE